MQSIDFANVALHREVCLHLANRVGQSKQLSFSNASRCDRGDTSQLALLSATEDDSFHPMAVIETIKRLGDLRTAAFRYLHAL